MQAIRQTHDGWNGSDATISYIRDYMKARDKKPDCSDPAARGAY